MTSFGALSTGLALGVGVLALAAGCSTSSESLGSGGAAATGGEGGALAGEVSCTADPRVDTYVAHLAKLGDRGVLGFELVESDPAPPARGSNRWQLRVSDAGGAPVSGALDVALLMPDHGHGTSVQPAVTPAGDPGTYTIDPVYLFMPGVWQVTLELTPDGADAPADRVSFYFCIEG